MKLGNRLFLLIFCTTIFASCSGVKYLNNGENLLYEQNIKGVKEANKNDIYDQILLEPNIRFPILGPVGSFIYETGEDAFDSAKIQSKREAFIQKIDSEISERAKNDRSTRKLESRKTRRLERFDKKLRLGNGRMRTGTPLVIYDSTLIQQSALRIENYLLSKGFRNAEVEVEKKEKKRKVFQTFVIEEGQQSFIDSLNLRTGDTTLTRIIIESKEDSYLQVGDYYDRKNLEEEQNRIDLLLRNTGYFEFTKRYIEFVIEYAPNAQDLWITTVINKPAERDYHKQFDIDSLIVNTNGAEAVQIEDQFEGVNYRFAKSYYSPKVLDTRLKLDPQQQYNYNDVLNTQRQLLSMDMFRFVNINFDTTLVQGKFLANIYTSPLQTFQLTQELGVNVTEGTLGPFYNLSLRNRNTFQGAEILQFSGFVGSDGVSAATDQSGALSNLQYGSSLSLTFPRFVTPFKSRDLSRNAFNAKSTLNLGFSFNRRREYVRSNINGTYAFTWQNEKGTNSYRLNIADINLVNTVDINPDFQKQLDDLFLQGNTLRESFNQSFVSSTSFNAVFNNNYGNQNTPSTFTRLFLEAGGTFYGLLGTGLLDNNNLTFYQFAKAQIDYRKFIPVNANNSWHWRINAGAAIPYGDAKTLPYEKFFFTGGSSSNRAWSPRRLGPGSAFPLKLDDNGDPELENGQPIPDRDTDASYRFERPGEILFEMNVEYRGKITGFIDWAFFVDAGNVWRYAEDNETTLFSGGGQFKADKFINELAIGAGFGLRFDFDFLVFRFDAGHKLKDPRFPEGQRWLKPFSINNQTVWNIAVGYPF